ncbi:succinylglutamate desuccinylase/aspartoacylase domain-containing protein [Natronorarus salvus]|uniref:succinylglutamate desuccinylase/aspartoacylase domain-containing protein n=1 Tax=Natronorarus salvus TaxID=3117733 RepID=UPI002F2639EF
MIDISINDEALEALIVERVDDVLGEIDFGGGPPGQGGESAYTTVGVGGDYDSLENAYDACAEGAGGEVMVLPTYSARNDSFPIEIDDRATGIRGQGYASTIDARGTSGPVFDLCYGAVRPLGAGINNLRIRGGDPGVLVSSARYSEMERVMIRDTDGVGLLLESDGSGAINTHDYRGLKIEKTASHGIHLASEHNSAAHSTRFLQTDVNFAGGHGLLLDGGFSVDFWQGTLQHSELHGLCGTEKNSGMIDVKGCYIEANNESGDVDAEVRLDRSFGSSITDCYFYDLGNGTPHAIVLAGRNQTVDKCTFRPYSRARIADETGQNTVRAEGCRLIGGGVLGDFSSPSGGEVPSGGGGTESDGPRGNYRINEGTDDETTVHVFGTGSPKTMVVANIHGNERSAAIAAERMIDEEWEPREGQLLVLNPAWPCADRNETRDGCGYDANRAFGGDPEAYDAFDDEGWTEMARGIFTAVEAEDPDVLIDLHASWQLGNGPARKIFPNGRGDSREFARNACDAVNAYHGFSGSEAWSVGNTVSPSGAGNQGMLVTRCHDIGVPALLSETYVRGGSWTAQSQRHLTVVAQVMGDVGHRHPPKIGRWR